MPSKKKRPAWPLSMAGLPLFRFAARSALVLVVAACGGVTPSQSPSAVATSASPQQTPPASLTPEPPAEVETAIRIREAVGLRSDRDWVTAVQRDPQSVPSSLGILVTTAEFTQLEQQLHMPDDYSALVAYGIRHADQYGGMYIDQAVSALVMLFTGDIATHQAAIAALPRGAGVNVRPCTFTDAELMAVLEDLDFNELRSQGIDVITARVDTIANVVRVEAKAASAEAGTQLEERYDGKLVATVHPFPGAWSNRGAGDGWQLVANMERSSEWAFRAQAATNQAAWEALWNELSPGLERPQVDLTGQIVAVFGVGIGGGCSEVRLDDVVIDQAGQRVYPKTNDPLAPRECDSSLTGAAVFVVALSSAALPPAPFKVFWQNPALCPTCDGSDGFTVEGG